MEINRCTCDMFVREIGKWLVSNDAVHKVYIGSGDAVMRLFAGCLQSHDPRKGHAKDIIQGPHKRVR